MKPSEFIPEEIIDEWSTTHPGIRQELENQGYKFLGAGMDQQAYLEPGTGQVLKIFGTQSATLGSGGSKLSKDQKMFVYWANFCTEHSDNKFLPRFSGFERFIYDHHTYFQIRMEKLEHLHNQVGRVLWDLSCFIRRNDELEIPQLMTHFSTAHDLYYRQILNYMDPMELADLASTIRTLFEIGSDRGWTLDLHEQNYMVRPDNTIVIVDPWTIL